MRIGTVAALVAMCASAVACTDTDPNPGPTTTPSRSTPVTPLPDRAEGRGEVPVVEGEPIDPAELTGRIVFDDYEDVYTMRPDGTDVQPVTSEPGIEFDGAASPDGAFIACRDSRRGINEDDEIFLLAVTAWFEYPAFSPDGTRIAFMGHSAGDYDIYVADVGTGRTTRLTDASGSDGWPAWSPDGTTIAFASERDDCARVPDDQDCWRGDDPGEHHDIWLMDANGGNQRRVTPESGQFVAWSPDGRYLLVSGRALYVVRPDGTGRTELRAEGFPLALGGLPDWSV